MKKLLLILLCVPLIGLGQTVKLTPCECVKYITAEMQLRGLKDRKELDNSDIKKIELLYSCSWRLVQRYQHAAGSGSWDLL